MKKVNLKNKLSIKKETIAKLNDNQMSTIKGGQQNSYPYKTTCCLNTGNVRTCTLNCKTVN